jgi:hypothetical protein
MHKLTANFAAYLKAEAIAAPKALLDLLTSDDVATKLALVKAHLCPRVATLRTLITDHLETEKIDVAVEKIDKCVRYLQAMAEVAAA